MELTRVRLAICRVESGLFGAEEREPEGGREEYAGSENQDAEASEGESPSDSDKPR